MGVVLNTNMSALAAYTNLRKTHGRIESTMEKLSSGLRINRAADDAAGLAISESLRTQINGSAQAQRNAQDGVSAMQTADGGLNETHAILQRMRTLAVHAANSGVLSQVDLRAIQAEMGQLRDEIDHIAYGSQFNGQVLLDGTFYKKNLQVGANAGDTQEVSIFSSLIPAQEATAAGTGIWNIDVSATLYPVTVEQTVGGATHSASIDPTPRPTSIVELRDALNSDPAFSQTFTARIDGYSDENGVWRADTNLVIEAKSPGYGAVKTNLTGVEKAPAPARGEYLGSDAVPEHVGGFAARDILGPIDVTALAQTVTVPASTTTQKYVGVGTGNLKPTTTTTPEHTVTTRNGATSAIEQIDRAIEIVSKGRSDIAAYQNSLTHTQANLAVTEENLAAADSRIRDADMAEEMTALAKDQIVAQAGTSMLAQANQLPQAMLKLLPNS